MVSCKVNIHDLDNGSDFGFSNVVGLQVVPLSCLLSSSLPMAESFLDLDSIGMDDLIVVVNTNNHNVSCMPLDSLALSVGVV